MGTRAVPVPEPAPVAINSTPTVLALAPMATKSVVPTVKIEYDCPGTKLPAAVTPGVVRKVTVLKLASIV